MDINAVRNRQQRIIEIQAGGIRDLLRRAGVRLMPGTGRILGPGRLAVAAADGTCETLDWDRLILATGSRPAPVAALPFDGRRIVSSNEALFFEHLPERLLIVGGGVIGCEFAGIFSALGTRVTLVEAMDRVLPLPALDEEISRTLLREMKKRRIDCHLDATASGVVLQDDGVAVHIAPVEGGPSRTVTVDTVLVCVGRRPNSEDLGLENVGVQTDTGGWIRVDDEMRTTADGIWAVGDLLGPARVMLAHVAAAEAAVAADNALGAERRMAYRAVPGAVFTMPEVAHVGLSQAQAQDAGLKVESASVLFRALGKAHVTGEIAGQAKIVYETPGGRILGVHLIGPRATDLIAEGTLAVQQGLTVAQLAATIHAHPTLAEIMGEAALKAAGTPLHG
jgi:dihydrolipoamide dehydrogenase